MLYGNNEYYSSKDKSLKITEILPGTYGKEYRLKFIYTHI